MDLKRRKTHKPRDGSHFMAMASESGGGGHRKKALNLGTGRTWARHLEDVMFKLWLNPW
jgi:hypothetical protein